MEENKKSSKWQKIITCIAVGLLIFSLVQIVVLRDQIDNLKAVNSRLSSEIKQINSNINSIYNNVDEKLKKQASILSGVNYYVGKINDDNETVPVSLKAVPKNLSDDMKISVKTGDETTALVRKGNEFTATINVGLFIGYEEFPLLTINSSKGTQTEYLEDVDLSYQFDKYFPTLEADIQGSSMTYRDSYAHINSTFNVGIQKYGNDSDVTFTKITLVEMLNGEEIGRKDITDKVTEADVSYTEKYEKDIDISDGYDLRLYVIAENSLGYTHEVLAGCWMDDKTEAMVETVLDNEIIYDKDGNMLWQKYISWN
jgi:hypothetical protein